jgi:addiction module HigA family antidote
VLKEDVLPALGLDEDSAARELDVTPEELRELLSGRLNVNAEWALRLGQFCGNGPSLWMDMQAAVDLWEAQNRLGEKLATIPRHSGLVLPLDPR